MGLRRRRDEVDAQLGTELEEEQVVRDAEQSLVAALQESDTAVEALADGGSDAGRAEQRRWRIGVAGLVLAALGIVVARRRS